MRRFIPLVIVLLLIAYLPASYAESTTAEVYHNISKNLGRIIFSYTVVDLCGAESEKGTAGSAVLIYFHGENKILTCYHVVKDKPIGNVTLYFSDGTSTYSPKVEVEFYNPPYDLLLFKIVEGDVPWRGVTIAEDLIWGDKIYFGGYSSFHLPKIRIGFAMFHHSEGIYLSPVYFGDSGGGVFNEMGELVGIIYRTFAFNGVPSLVGYAMPIISLMKQLE